MKRLARSPFQGPLKGPLLTAALLLSLSLVNPVSAQFIGNSQSVSGTATPSSSTQQLLDGILAVVNKDVILASELVDRLRTLVREMRSNNKRIPSQEILEKQVLDRLILEKLQLQIATRRGIKVDDETLNRAMTSIAQRNGLSLRQFRDVLQKEGFGFVAFREKIRRELILRQVRQRQVSSKIRISKAEIERFMELQNQRSDDTEYHLGHILIGLPSPATPESVRKAQDKAKEILRQLREGADFNDMAIANSNGRRALEGGDLGWRKQSQIPSLFEDLVAKMSKGEVSNPIRSPSGFHIIKIHDVRAEAKHMVKQTRLRHILIKPNEILSSDQVKQRLNRIRTRLIGGDDFNTLARSNSDDPGSAVKGGDLGWTNPGEMVPAFEKAMLETKVGELSPVFKSRFGWHILEVLERREKDLSKEFKESKARESLLKRKTEEETTQWLQGLRNNAYIEIIPH